MRTLQESSRAYRLAHPLLSSMIPEKSLPFLLDLFTEAHELYSEQSKIHRTEAPAFLLFLFRYKTAFKPRSIEHDHCPIARSTGKLRVQTGWRVVAHTGQPHDSRVAALVYIPAASERPNKRNWQNRTVYADWQFGRIGDSFTSKAH